MNAVAELSRVRTVENCWVPMPDGVRLAAALWLPADAETKPVPAILEIVPYRKRDGTAFRDHQTHSFLAERGFAGVRVDMRGTGDSEGLFDAHQTYADIVEILAWLGRQPWCTGDLGMIGLSWGGINAVMAAEKQPPGLKAVVACSFSHDRYAVGMVWKNGCILHENFAWATAVTGFCTRPPDPAVLGDDWRSVWMNRLNNLQPEVQFYLGRQRREEYWDKHRVKEPGRIECPLYMFGGWADSNYAQSLPALLPAVSGPRKAVFGPWAHKYPHQAYPGPSIDFLGEAIRWFSRWLRGEKNGVENDPLVRAYMLEDLPAKSDYAEAPGRWVAEENWPPASSGSLDLFLGAGRLTRDAPEAATLTFRSPQTVGLASGETMPWFAYAPGPELPGDQREDDGKSLTFDTAPLDADVETLGAPVLDLEFSVDRPTAFLAIRLCDVKPDGSSARINLGLQNLTRRDSDREPSLLEPGKRYRLSLPLDVKGYVFRRGHRIRLALSTSYWPMVWPSPEPVTLTVFAGRSALHIPLWAGNEAAVSLGQPRTGPSPARTEIVPVNRRRSIHQDLMTMETIVTLDEENGTVRFDDIDWTVSSQAQEVYRIREDDPLSARTDVSWNWRYSRGDWEVRTETKSRLTAEKDKFICTLDIKAYENAASVFERSWTFELPRDML